MVDCIPFHSGSVRCTICIAKNEMRYVTAHVRVFQRQRMENNDIFSISNKSRLHFFPARLKYSILRVFFSRSRLVSFSRMVFWRTTFPNCYAYKLQRKQARVIQFSSHIDDGYAELELVYTKNAKT